MKIHALDHKIVMWRHGKVMAFVTIIIITAGVYHIFKDTATNHDQYSVY